MREDWLFVLCPKFSAVCVYCTAAVYNCALLRQNGFGPNRPLSPLLYCLYSILSAADQEQLIWSLRGGKAPVLLLSFTLSDFSLFPGAARELNHYTSLLCGSTQLSKIRSCFFICFSLIFETLAPCCLNKCQNLICYCLFYKVPAWFHPQTLIWISLLSSTHVSWLLHRPIETTLSLCAATFDIFLLFTLNINLLSQISFLFTAMLHYYWMIEPLSLFCSFFHAVFPSFFGLFWKCLCGTNLSFSLFSSSLSSSLSSPLFLVPVLCLSVFLFHQYVICDKWGERWGAWEKEREQDGKHLGGVFSSCAV